jgi:hypothetical protein
VRFAEGSKLLRCSPSPYRMLHSDGRCHRLSTPCLFSGIRFLRKVISGGYFVRPDLLKRLKSAKPLLTREILPDENCKKSAKSAKWGRVTSHAWATFLIAGSYRYSRFSGMTALYVAIAAVGIMSGSATMHSELRQAIHPARRTRDAPSIQMAVAPCGPISFSCFRRTDCT